MLGRLIEYIRKGVFPSESEMREYAAITESFLQEMKEGRPIGISKEFQRQVLRMGGLSPILPPPRGIRDDN